jgi:small GTP-binding protein
MNVLAQAQREIQRDLRVALVGNPNCGKTALFNALTGSHQRVANYPGVTVERKEGSFATPAGRRVLLLDLPGTYSLRARSPDEQVTRDVVLGSQDWCSSSSRPAGRSCWCSTCSISPGTAGC